MKAFDETFDFVVVGNGGGSMCAALVMREAQKSVVILEKTAFVGGTTARSGGVMWIPNNPFMAEAGIADSEADAIAYLDATVGAVDEGALGATKSRRLAYVRKAPEMVRFLLKQGVKLRRAKSWPDYYDERSGGSVPGRAVVADLFDMNRLGDWREKFRPNYMTLPLYSDEGFEIATFKSSFIGKVMMAKVGLRKIWSTLRGQNLVTFGAALQGRMLEASLKAGVDLRLNSGVTSLIESNGRVVGVVTSKDGREWHIGARKAVLINAGGFAQNQRMRDQYAPGTSAKWTGVCEGDTGEMIEEMMRHGANISQMNECVGNQMSIPPGAENLSGDGVELSAVSGQMDIAKPHSIVVDQSGVRYMNEAGSYMTFCQNMLARDKLVPASPSWWVFDSNYISTYMLAGTIGGTKKPKNWYASGYLKKAETIAELAKLIGVPSTVLEAQIERFNDGARLGVDPEFGRGARAYDEWLGDHYHGPSNTLGPIEKGPFYAAPVVPGDVGTYGGVVTDEFGQVLRPDGSVISGLYATGVSTASVMGRCYPGAGSSVGPSFVFGYIAAQHALAAG